MKNFAVTFSPFALDDIEQVVDYYNQLQPGLSKRFTQLLQQSLTAIKRNPFFTSVRYGNIRCAQVKKFPYLVHYHIDEKQGVVTIVAVYSTHKEPFR
ncbi:MAG TPA: type II toxin-antitoxin system RelE/ParE family toxin [Agriterribacter sp.]|nr:type II toxin-antitoxin system RelE/ParE family toxin [Agriterribacter sp.]HRQ51691.1 type II toxin-antitoxin system RelE/ParE family toxin [Agriterribacter sp.]